MLKNLLFVFCLFVSISLYAVKKVVSKNVVIKGHITRTSSYCGGAQPSPEMLEILKTPRALEQTSIFIKIGNRNDGQKTILKKVITDDYGNFTVVLKSGVTYIFVEEWKSKQLVIPEDTENTKWDAQCIKQRYATPDFILKTKKSGNPIVNINYHTPCFYKPYCGLYSGPLPP